MISQRVTLADVQRNKTLVFHPDTFQVKPKEHITRVLMTLVISDAMQLSVSFDYKVFPSLNDAFLYYDEAVVI